MPADEVRIGNFHCALLNLSAIFIKIFNQSRKSFKHTMIANLRSHQSTWESFHWYNCHPITLNLVSLIHQHMKGVRNKAYKSRKLVRYLIESGIVPLSEFEEKSLKRSLNMMSNFKKMKYEKYFAQKESYLLWNWFLSNTERLILTIPLAEWTEQWMKESSQSKNYLPKPCKEM